MLVWVFGGWMILLSLKVCKLIVFFEELRGVLSFVVYNSVVWVLEVKVVE